MKPLSTEDRPFLQKYTDEIHMTDDHHLEITLPLKNENIKLPKNRDLALKRFTGIKKPE